MLISACTFEFFSPQDIKRLENAFLTRKETPKKNCNKQLTSLEVYFLLFVGRVCIIYS